MQFSPILFKGNETETDILSRLNREERQRLGFSSFSNALSHWGKTRWFSGPGRCELTEKVKNQSELFIAMSFRPAQVSLGFTNLPRCLGKGWIFWIDFVPLSENWDGSNALKSETFGCVLSHFPRGIEQPLRLTGLLLYVLSLLDCEGVSSIRVYGLFPFQFHSPKWSKEHTQSSLRNFLLIRVPRFVKCKNQPNHP